MFIDDGGSGPVTPDYASSPQQLSVEPSAIPAARAAFETALDKVTQQLAALAGTSTPAWAGDPVSHETAQKFNDRTHSDANSAVDVLKGYQKQLQGAVDALKATEARYRQVEGDNAALWGKHGR